MADTRISKLLSYLLRHRPDSYGLHLDPQGWVAIDELLTALQRHGIALDRPTLDRLVATDAKQRYGLNPDGTCIRANQGHTVPIDLGLSAEPPPETLYHGTAVRHLAAILREGLQRGRRHHVHLSADAATARQVGRRHGTPVVLRIDSGCLYRDGGVFYRSTNGIWLTDHVAPRYLAPIDQNDARP